MNATTPLLCIALTAFTGCGSGSVDAGPTGDVGAGGADAEPVDRPADRGLDARSPTDAGPTPEAGRNDGQVITDAPEPADARLGADRGSVPEDAAVGPPDLPRPDAHVPFECRYGPRIEVGTVAAAAEPGLVEASGLVQSRLDPGVFWAHNDNGNDRRLFAIARDGRYLATYELDLPSAQDVEALAVGPGSAPGRSDLYLGDVGANWRIWGCSTPNVDTGDCAGCPTIPARCGGICDCRQRDVQVFRLPEPPVDPEQEFTEVRGVAVTTYTLRFPDAMLGQRQDVEAMMVDPQNGDLYLVTKHTAPGRLLRAAAPLSTEGPNLLEPVAELPWGGENQATAADISADGWLVGVRRYGDVHVWERPPGQTVAQALQGEACRIEAGEIQGESFAFDVGGSGSFYSLSESAGAATVPLYLYPRQ